MLLRMNNSPYEVPVHIGTLKQNAKLRQRSTAYKLQAVEVECQ